MKKYLKIMLICMMIFLTMQTYNTTYAELGNGLSNSILDDVTQNNTALSSGFETTFSRVFGTLFFVLRVLGVCGIVYNGVKYMYAGSEDKAKIKQSLIFVVIGTIFIFGASIVVDTITNGWNNVIG